MKTLLLTAALLCAVAQQSMGFAPELDGTMMPYRFTREATVVPWDSTYTPCGVVYVARHGARFLSSEHKTEALRAFLYEANADGRLTARGNAFMQLLHRVDSVTDGRWGALSPLGEQEEQKLGQELYDVAGRLMHNARVDAKATYVPRVVMTMYEFCHRLTDNSNDIEISTAEGRQFDPLLRYFTTDSDYVEYLREGMWKAYYDQFLSATTPVEPAAGLTDQVVDKNRLQRLTLDMYGVIQSLRASGIDMDASEWFTEDEYRACWEVNNLKHYYQRTANEVSDIAELAAEPLLETIIADVDAAFAGNGNDHANVHLYFGHAETILPLFGLMNLPGCSSPDTTPGDVANVWRDYDIAPLGANLLIICLTDNAGNPMVAMRLNGNWLRPVTLDQWTASLM